MCAEWRIGVELIHDEENESEGGRPPKTGNGELPLSKPVTLAEKVVRTSDNHHSPTTLTRENTAYIRCSRRAM